MSKRASKSDEIDGVTIGFLKVIEQIAQQKMSILIMTTTSSGKNFEPVQLISDYSDFFDRISACHDAIIDSHHKRSMRLYVLSVNGYPCARASFSRDFDVEWEFIPSAEGELVQRLVELFMEPS